MSEFFPEPDVDIDYVEKDSLIEVKHYNTKLQCSFTFFYDPIKKKIYRKSNVSPWLEKYLRYDDAEYKDILRFNSL